MTEETKEIDITTEKAESVGQIIAGELERIGGMLTADPIAQAESELVEDAGKKHLEVAEELEKGAETQDS